MLLVVVVLLSLNGPFASHYIHWVITAALETFTDPLAFSKLR